MEPHGPQPHKLKGRVVVYLGMLANRSMSWRREGQKIRKGKADETG